MKSLTQNKVVDIADYRSLQTGREALKIGIVSADKNYVQSFQESLPPGLELISFENRATLEAGLKKQDLEALILDERSLKDEALSLCEKLKREKQMDELVILIISEDKSKERIRAGLEKGCDEWVARTDDFGAMVRLLDHHLSL